MACLPHSTFRRCLAGRHTSCFAAPAIAAALSLLASGCVGLGSHIEGSFSCRAPKGDCAPSQVIDAAATAELGADRGPIHGIDRTPDIEAARKRAGVEGSDASRTAERTIRIVFPAHVDEAGVLHDEAQAWAVVERPQWSGALRAQDRGDTASMRAMRRQLRHAQSGRETAGSGDGAASGTEQREEMRPEDVGIGSDRHIPTAASDDSDMPLDLAAPDETSPFHLAPSLPASPQIASPLPLPSPVAEATTGAPAPAAGGSGSTSYPKDRIPRHLHDAPHFPAAAVIEVARAKAAESRTAESRTAKPSREHSSGPPLPAPAQSDPVVSTTKHGPETK